MIVSDFSFIFIACVKTGNEGEILGKFNSDLHYEKTCCNFFHMHKTRGKNSPFFEVTFLLLSNMEPF